MKPQYVDDLAVLKTDRNDYIRLLRVHTQGGHTVRTPIVLPASRSKVLGLIFLPAARERYHQHRCPRIRQRIVPRLARSKSRNASCYVAAEALGFG